MVFCCFSLRWNLDGFGFYYTPRSTPSKSQIVGDSPKVAVVGVLIMVQLFKARVPYQIHLSLSGASTFFIRVAKVCLQQWGEYLRGPPSRTRGLSNPMLFSAVKKHSSRYSLSEKSRGFG